MEGYLDTVSNRSHRVWYAKIMMSNHRFAVENGRFSKIPRDERLCSFCKAQQKPSVVDTMQFITDRSKVLLLWFFTVVLVYICGMLAMWPPL